VLKALRLVASEPSLQFAFKSQTRYVYPKFAHEYGIPPSLLVAGAVEQQQHVAVAPGGGQDTCAPGRVFLEHYWTRRWHLMHRRP
jgi:hypothetical protein